MSRIHLAAATILLSFAAGCGFAKGTPPVAPSTPEPVAETAPAPEATTDDTTATTTTDAPAPAVTEPTAAHREIGDYIVYRFTGTFHKAPMTLTQKVIDRQASVLTIDVTLDDGGKKDAFRIRTDETSTEKGLLSVAKLDGTKEIASTSAAYEAMLQKTVLSADRNEDFLGEEKVTLDVAGKQVACTKSSFKVQVGKKTATLHIVASDELAWGDAGGDITTKDGKVLYRAEILDAGSAKPTTPKSTNAVATTDE
jgi:hypothetical protein